MKVAPLFFVLLLGCSSGSGSSSLDGGSSGSSGSSSKCDAIAEDIRQAATKRGYAGADVCADRAGDPEGLCERLREPRRLQRRRRLKPGYKSKQARSFRIEPEFSRSLGALLRERRGDPNGN